MSRLEHLKNIIIFIFILSMVIVTGCSTGIESTKTIKMSRADQKNLHPSAEQQLIDTVRPKTLNQWQPGKLFYITDNRASMVYDFFNSDGSRSQIDSIAGLIIAYEGINSEFSPAGEDVGVIVFRKINRDNTLSQQRITYNTNQPVSSINSIIWRDLPLLVDLEMIDQYRELLIGRKLWTRTDLWYGADGLPIRGAKFVPVTISDIVVGDSAFPLKIIFNDGNITAAMPMNMTGRDSGFESRTFQSLFSLIDPKSKYPDISPEVWELICHGRVKEGMTKLECKLALGAPMEVISGHDWNNLIDIWQYSNGTFLRFQDGLLIK